MASISEKRLQHQGSTPRRLDIHYLKTITNNFSEDQILGRGGYGIVYKGQQENGEVVAVKKLIMTMAGIDDKQFMNEVKHAMDICHPNIVRLEGYCYQTEKELTIHNGCHIFVDEVYRLLCFEYLPNGSLDKYITDESSGLDWHTRYNIIEGICTGLYCLHEGREGSPILHLDLKPSNILLDKNMTPKIADFGLSRLFDEGKTHTCDTKLIGSRGYMPPEYIDSLILSKESDIFSLGVIIVEIVTGHRKYPEGTSSEEFIEVYEKWRTRLQETSKKTSLEEEFRQVDQCIQVGLKCMGKDPKRRPNIREIVEIIERTECSVRDDGSVGEEQTGKLVHEEWREKLDIAVSGSAEQSIEALKAIGIELNDWIFYSCVLPKYIIEDADSLVSSLTLMVQKAFRSNIVGSSSRHLKCTLNIIMQVFQIRQLVRAVKKGTLEELVTEMLIWLSAEEAVEMDDASKLFEALNTVMLEILGNVDTTSFYVILVKLLVPLDHSRWPSCTPLGLIAVTNNRLPGLAVKYLRILKENLENTINDLELDLILQSIHAFLEPLGRKDIHIRAENDDMQLQVVIAILGGLVKLVGSEIKGHLSMVPMDAEHGPIILELIDRFLEEFAEAVTSVPPTGQTFHHSLAIREGDGASCSANPSEQLTVNSADSDGDEQSGKWIHPEWREKLDTVVSGSSEQSMEALKAIGLELNDWIVDTCVLPPYIIKDADNLVSRLTLMVQKTFSSNISWSSSRYSKCTLNIILQVVQIRQLVCAVKKGTLEELVTEMLIWIVKMDEEVVKTDESSPLEDLIVVVDNILENADKTSLFVAIINLLRPLDPSRWPSSTPLELLPTYNNRLSDFVAKCLLWLNKHLGSTINDLDLDLILQSINAFLEQVGVNELQRRAASDDKPVLMVLTLLRELVKLVGSNITGHLSMLPIGDCWLTPVILAYIDIFLKDLAAATMSAPPTGQISHGGDAASCSTNPSSRSLSESRKKGFY